MYRTMKVDEFTEGYLEVFEGMIRRSSPGLSASL
jgi:hypothetical protein